jgi:hypothetical protein
MDRLDNRVRRGRQEPVHKMWTGDRFGFRAPVALEFSPDAREGEQRAVLIEGEPNDILAVGLWVRFSGFSHIRGTILRLT